ncbi:nuclear transport factor 2 family protein [Deltaproteobacteria bacterium]|nr:nuclear transport factor 2 family protein [Deltaproteobacteria bacterium]
MKTKVKYLAIIFACFVIGLTTSGGCVQEEAKSRTITDAEQARAMWACQNVMSKHNYYHAVGYHLEELMDIWVKEDGDYAKTATFSNPNGVWEGIDLIKIFYGNPSAEDPNQSIEEMLKNQIKDPNDGMGNWAIHLNTTPVLEIAGDGKTAKGVWYSPGVHVGISTRENGTTETSGGWWWEKYGVDFAKEDGKWKIWHIQMFYDHTPRISAETGSTIWTEPMSIGTGETQETATRANPNRYKMWGPNTVPVLRPELPEPYYTFSETFSY